MRITKNNLNDVIFENQDARLLIEDVVTNTPTNLYYFHDKEITVEQALKIWYNAQAALDSGIPYSVSFFTKDTLGREKVSA